MKKHLQLFILFICSITNAQIKATITSSNDNTPIPYVNIWIENENVGATSNTDGFFEITADTTNKNIVFSALGFETLTIPVNEIKDKVILINSAEELDEVLLLKRKNKESLTIGEFKKRKVNSYYACGTTPWIFARYFPYYETYSKTPFLKHLDFITNTHYLQKKGKVNIRLYEVGENGYPGDYLFDENIIIDVDKGTNITTVNFNNLDIIFPKNGFFIAIEWLVIKDNYYEREIEITGKKEKYLMKGYNPSVGVIPMKTDEYSFLFKQGKWKKAWKNKGSLKRYKDKYSTLAMKLHLSN